MKLRDILIMLFTLFAINSFSQNDSINLYRQIHFVKLNQANDLFTYWFQSDREYSDGVNIEVAHQIFNNKYADLLLVGVKGSPYKDFSLSISQDMYTPANTKDSNLLKNDRPYAGQLFLTYAKYSNDFWKGRKLVSRIFVGIQGPAAFGGEAQNTVHTWIDNPTANGWSHQMNNGLVLDYEIQYLQQLPLITHITELHAFSRIRIGTIINEAELGFRFKFGHYTDSYTNFYGIANPKYTYKFKANDLAKLSSNRKKIIPKRLRNKSPQVQIQYLNDKLNRKFQFYFFTEGMLNYLLRDGAVEGSLIQFSPNEYVYSYNDYQHFSMKGRYGFVFQYHRFYMEYMHYMLTDAYELTSVFGYGRVILSYVF